MSPSATRSARPPISDRDFNRDNFDATSAEITNPYFPMVPGTRYRWKGHAYDDGEKVTREIESTVTDLTKIIHGVRTRVGWDRDITDGEAEEVELTFYAQDKFGTVWYFGEYSEEYDDKEIKKSPTWLAGLAGARAGVMMQAEPRTGTPDYAEGWGGKSVPDWKDRASVDGIKPKDCVPTGCYRNVVVIKEFSVDEPGLSQLKSYAPGVGNIRTGYRGKDPEKEQLALVALQRLSPAALADIRQDVQDEEKRAYTRQPELFGKTPPMERD